MILTLPSSMPPMPMQDYPWLPRSRSITAQLRRRTARRRSIAGDRQSHASESATFALATWKAYKSNKTIKFTLSKSLGTKTVYFKVKNATGESAVVSDTITLKKALAESAASLEGADTARPVFVADAPGDYDVRLTVTDEQMHSASDTVTVSFENVRPTANAGKSLAVKVGDTVTLAGDGTDANGDALRYQWIVSSRPGESLSEMADSSARVTSFIPDRAGAYVVQLVVNDGDLDSEPCAIQIQAFTTQTKTIKALQGLEAEIAELDSGAFGNADMQNALLNKLNAVIANVEAGKHADAANQLRNDILAKMGGVEDTEGNSAIWIIDRSAQRVWYQDAQDVVGALEMAR